jgi:hypothetical protein
MGKVDAGKYGSARPKILREDLQDGDFIVLTIANFDEATISDEEGKRVTPYLEFQETGDKVLWLNKTQVGYLIEGMQSDDSDDWKGKKVPIEKVTNTYNGRKFDKVAIAAPERWEEYFDAAGIGTAKKRKPRAAAVRGKRK